MPPTPKNEEEERFKRIFADELLEYHFERVIGKNEDNEKQWRVLLDEHIEPHAEILCDFSNWLLDRGWSKETVEKLFFVAVKEDQQDDADVQQEIPPSQLTMTYIKPDKYKGIKIIAKIVVGLLAIGLVAAIFFIFVK